MSLPPRRPNRANWAATLRQVPQIVGEALRTQGGASEPGKDAPGGGADPPTPDPAGERLALVNQDLARRLDDLDRRLAAGAEEDDFRAEALERRLEARVEEAVAVKEAESANRGQAIEERFRRLEEEGESQRMEVRAQLRAGLADIRAAAAVPADMVDRLQALEKQGRQIQAELAEIVELHAALDAGLGTLRSEIGDVRSAIKRVADGQADVDDRLETYVRASLATDAAKGRRSGRKGAEENRAGAVTAAIEGLILEQRQLRQDLASLAQASDASAAAASRAASQISALNPLRSEIKLLHEEIAEQEDAIAALRKTVEADRHNAAAPPSAAKRAPAKKNA